MKQDNMAEKINPNKTKYYLNCVLHNKLDELKKVAERIATLSHQIEYFDDMHEHIKNQVIRDLNENLQELKYDVVIKEVD